MKKCDQKEFIERAKKVHEGHNIDFSKVHYINMNTKVILIDHTINPYTGKEYGEYEQTPYKCLKGQLNSERSYVERGLKHRLTTEEFIKRAKAVHKGENLDFSKSEYVTAFTKICVIDHDINPETGEEYGEYWQVPSLILLGGSGHPKKGRNSTKEKLKMSTEEFIKKAKKAHPNEKLDYSKTRYINSHTDVCIIDHDINPETGKEYGEYWQNPFAHLKGSGCPRKGWQKRNKLKSYSQDEIINKMKEAHPDECFDFSEFEYKGYQVKGKIICHHKNSEGYEHGAFWMTPDCFMRTMYGCPKCASTGRSQAEDELGDFISSLVGKGNVIEGSYDLITPKQVDIYVPKKKIAIEYDGLYWHSLKGFNYHLDKMKQCKEKDVRLINVFEDEWISKKQLVKDKLSYIFGLNENKQKVGARKCEIREIYKSDSDAFLEQNHIQGKASASVYLGAFYQGKLVSVMLFKKTGKDGEYELSRFASDTQYVIQGIASKLLKYFIKMNLAKSIISFADLRWTDEDDNMYIKLGFNKVEQIPPTYSYFRPTDPSIRYHKFNFRKQILCKKYPDVCTMDMTEKEMTEKLGYARIYDCGLIKYELKVENIK